MTPFVKMNFIYLRIKKSFSYQRLRALQLRFKTEACDNLELADKRNKTNNTNWMAANQLDIYNLGWGFNQIQPAIRAGIEARVFGLQVQRPNHSATLPPTLEALISAIIFQFSSYLSSPVHLSSDTLADLHYKTRSIDVEFSLKKQP